MSMILLGHTKREVECSVLRLLNHLQRPLLFISLCVRGSSYVYAACEIDRDSQEVKR